MSVTDATILATMVEGVLLVIKAEAVPRKAAIEARNIMAEVKAPLLGAVFNNIPMNGKGYGYYYSQYYRYHSYYPSDSDNDKPPTPRRRRHQPETGPLAWVKGRINHLRQLI
jgi:Mrp family chromosome partitioning ATPase